MSGLTRFDFYPRDWFTDTRELTDRAKGCYIDLLAAIYNRGRPLPYDEKYLAQICGYGNVRSLRLVLGELLEKGKLTIVETDDGKVLVNNRAREEIAKAERHIANGKKGGKKIIIENLGRNGAEMEPKPSPLHAETKVGFVKKQGSNLYPPSPSPSIEEDAAPKRAGASADPVKAIFDLGVDILTQAGRSESQARSLVGKWRKELTDEKLASILVAAKSKTDPAGYISKAVKNSAVRGEGKPHPNAERMKHDARLQAFRSNGYWDDTWGPHPEAPLKKPAQRMPVREKTGQGK